MFTPSASNPRLAVLLMLLASACAAGTTLLAKALGTGVLGPNLHPLQISHGRFLFAFLIIGTVVAIRRPVFTHIHIPLHVGRSVLGWGGVTLMFAAAAFIPLSDATAISFLNPVFGMILAIPFLGEKVGRVRWSAAAIALLGAVVLIRPGGGALQFGALLALGSALLLGVELILIKQLSGKEAPLQVLLINNGIGLMIATVALLFIWQMPTPAQWVALAGIGGLMAVAQACFINAMARADASFVAPLFYATLVFASAYDAMVFRVIPDAVSLMGSAIILSGGGVMAWREAGRKRLQ